MALDSIVRSARLPSWRIVDPVVTGYFRGAACGDRLDGQARDRRIVLAPRNKDEEWP